MKILANLSIQLLLFCLYAASFSVNAQDFSPQLTEFGHPDLRGVWNFSNKTPLERPERFGDQEFLTNEQLASTHSQEWRASQPQQRERQLPRSVS